MFRPEAIEARKQKLHGDIFLTSPVSFKLITALLTLLLALIIFFLLTGSYARTERVPGYLVPEGGIVKIQAGRFGTITALHVKEGDSVAAGDTLLSVEIAQATANGMSVEARSLKTLEEQRQNLRNQIVLEQNLLASETARMQAEIEAAKLEAASLVSQIGLQKEITRSARTSFMDVQELLDKGYISKIESERRRQAWLSQKALEKLREQELESAGARLEQFKIRMAQLPGEVESRIALLAGQLLEMDAREAELSGRKAYMIEAPVSGRIASIMTGTVGQTILPQQVLLSIMPEGSSLTAELFVPSRAVGFVEEGQEARILYAAFPYQRFGSYPARIKSVSQTILSPGEAVTPLQLQEPVYRVTAVLESESVEIGGKKIALQSGMQLEATIILEKRTFLDWLLTPLRVVGRRS